jgi:hypothetical protein
MRFKILLPFKKKIFLLCFLLSKYLMEPSLANPEADREKIQNEIEFASKSFNEKVMEAQQIKNIVLIIIYHLGLVFFWFSRYPYPNIRFDQIRHAGGIRY